MRPSASPVAIWIGIVVLYFVWGSTYLGIKVAIDTMPPFLMGGFRFLAAGVVLTGALLVRHRGSIRRPTLAEGRDATIIGGCLLLGGMGLVAWGEQTVPSGIAALLIALMPMWLAVFSWVLFSERLPVLAIAGVGIGLAGVAILVGPSGELASIDPAGLAALIASPICWSLGSLYAARRAVLPAPALFAVGIQMIAGGTLLTLAALATGEFQVFDLGAVSLESWIGLAYLISIGSLVGFVTYGWLIHVAPLSRVATYAYVNPVVAVILGAVVLGEPLTPRTAVAGAIIVLAVALIVTARGRSAARPPAVRVDFPAPIETTGG